MCDVPWSTEFAPTAYNDPQMLAWVGRRGDSESLVAMNNAGTIFELSLDHAGPIDAGPPLVAVVYGYPQALIGETLYMIRDETPEAFGGFDLVAVDLTTGSTGEVITQTVGWPFAAADTTRTRLIWGSDTQVGTAETMFSLETYLTGLAW